MKSAPLLVIAAMVSAPALALGTWETTLQGRDLDGNPNTFEAYYDTALNITWLQNANAGAGAAFFDDGLYSNDGRMTWAHAYDWAHSLVVGGIGGWRLPSMIDTGAAGCPVAEFSLTGGTSCGQNVITTPGSPNASEMGHMYRVTLGNNPAFVEGGVPDSGGNLPRNPTPWLANTGPFAGIFEAFNVINRGTADCSGAYADYRDCRDDAYWFDNFIPGVPGGAAWKFLFGEGEQVGDTINAEFFAWAVHDGDIAPPPVPVPLPASLWLLLTGIAGWKCWRTASKGLPAA